MLMGSIVNAEAWLLMIVGSTQNWLFVVNDEG